MSKNAKAIERRTTVADVAAAVVDLHAAVRLGFVSLETRLDGKLDKLRYDITKRFDGVYARLDRIDDRLSNVEFRLDQVETRLDGVEARLLRLETPCL